MRTTLVLAAVSPAANTLNGQGWKHGRHPVSELIGALSDLDYVDAVVASDLDATDE